MTRKGRRILQVAAALMVVGALSTAPVWMVDLGRRVEWLQIRRVEVSGTRLLPPHEVLVTSGIVQGDHLLDHLDAWEAALLAHPVIEAVTIRRRLPHTIRIRVTEKHPVALVSDGTLKLATATGEILPIDPADAALDLPLVRASYADSAAAAQSRSVLSEVDRLSRLAPDLMRDVSELGPYSRAPGVLLVTHRAAEILIPIGVPAERLAQLRDVLADVERRYPPVEARPRQRKHQLDLRFDGQVVVRPSSREFS